MSFISQQFFVERWKKNGSFGFSSVGSGVGKNQMCHLCGWLFTLSDNGSQVYLVADFEAQNFKFRTNE